MAAKSTHLDGIHKIRLRGSVPPTAERNRQRLLILPHQRLFSHMSRRRRGDVFDEQESFIVQLSVMNEQTDKMVWVRIVLDILGSGSK